MSDGETNPAQDFWGRGRALFILGASATLLLYVALVIPVVVHDGNRLLLFQSACWFFAIVGFPVYVLLWIMQGAFCLIANRWLRGIWRKLLILTPCILAGLAFTQAAGQAVIAPPTAASCYEQRFGAPPPPGMRNLRYVHFFGIDPSWYFFFESDAETIEFLVAEQHLAADPFHNQDIEAVLLINMDKHWRLGIQPTWRIDAQWQRMGVRLFTSEDRSHGCIHRSYP